MNPLLIGLGILGFLFASSRAKAARMPTFPAPQPAGPPPPPPGTVLPPDVAKPVYVPVPVGFRRVKDAEVTPDITAKARDILKLGGPVGSSYPFTGADGKSYLALIEVHTNAPGSNVPGSGVPHRGVSLVTRV